MTYNETLAQRIRLEMGGLPGLIEKKMFGGIGYLLNGNMACGVHGDGLIVRVGTEQSAAALSRPHTRVFDLTGKAMAGWLVVDPPGCASDANLRTWIDIGVKYALTLPPK
jgi:hypothetical protein